MQTRIGDIHAGLPDAKDDIRLNEWQFKESYVIPPKFHIGNLINGNIYYIIGNKGLGKTAAMRYLALMLRKDNNRTVTSFLLFEQDYTHQGKTGMESTAAESIITYDMENDQSLDVMDFSLVWRWHLYLRMVEANAEGSIFVQDKNWKKFSRFVLGVSKCEPKATVSGKLEIQLPENLPFFNFIQPHISIELPEFEIGRRDYSFEDAMAEADACFTKLQRRDTPFYFFIDELDVHYGDERNYIRDLRLVHDLVVEVKRMNLLIHDLQWTGIKLFCTLRPEVIRAIDNHLPAKDLAREIEGFSITLSWVSETEETYTSPIMKLFLKRIEKAEEENGEAVGSDAARYNRWFPDRIDGMEPSDYIQSITWSRPRDIVRLLRAAQSARGTDQAFTKYVFQALLREYSKGSLNEIKGELEASYPGPEIRKLMLCFQDLPERFTLADFQEGIEDVYGQDENKPDAIAILNDLYRVGIIGQVTGNRVRWAYKGDSDFRNRKDQVNVVHKGLIHALCVSPEKESQTGDDGIEEQVEEELKKQEEAECQRIEAERKKREEEAERKKREKEERQWIEAELKIKEETKRKSGKKYKILYWVIPVALCLGVVRIFMWRKFLPMPMPTPTSPSTSTSSPISMPTLTPTSTPTPTLTPTPTPTPIPTPTQNIDLSEDYEYTILDDGTIEISKFKGEEINELVIPATIEEKDVTSIGEKAFSGRIGLKSIKLPDGITTIETYAFFACRGLTSIELPDGLTTIEDYAFDRCSGLSSIKLPSSLTTIGNGAFSGCYGLTSIELSSGLTTIRDYVFSGCSGLTSIELPPDITTIGDFAFYGCWDLIRIKIPNSVTQIGSFAFSNCANNLTLIVEKDSYAEEYAKKEKIPYEYANA